MTAPAEIAAMTTRLNKDLSTIEVGMAVASIPVPHWWQELRETVSAAPKIAGLTAVADQLARATSEIQQSQTAVGRHRDAVPAAWVGQAATAAVQSFDQLDQSHAILAEVLGGFSTSLHSYIHAWINFLKQAIPTVAVAAASVAALLYATDAGGTMGSGKMYATEAAADAAARAAARFFWQVMAAVAVVIIGCIAALVIEWHHFESLVGMESPKVRELTARVADQVSWPAPPTSPGAAPATRAHR